MNKYLIALSVVVGILFVGVAFLFFGGSSLLSASGSGPNHYQAENFLQGAYFGTLGQYHINPDGGVSTTKAFSASTTHVGAFVEGGSQVTFTTTSSITAAQVCQTSQFYVANTTATITLTLPVATATIAVANCLATNGDFLRFAVFNNGTNTVAFATSTGDTISKPFNSSGTTSLSTSTGPNPIGWFTLSRITSTTTHYTFSQFGPGL